MSLPQLRAIGVPRRTLAWAAGMLLLALAGLWLVMARPWQGAPNAHFVELADGVYILPRPDALAPFRLTRHDGTAFDNAALQGRWSFVVFGYTSCPDFCPTALAAFAQTHELLAQRAGGTRDVQFVMVSVDPARDTPALLGEYLRQFNREFIGATGEAAAIAPLADSVGAVWARVPGGTDSSYLIDHSSAALLINPRGRLQGVFAAPHTARRLADGLQRIRARSGRAAEVSG